MTWLVFLITSWSSPQKGQKTISWFEKFSGETSNFFSQLAHLTFNFFHLNNGFSVLLPDSSNAKFSSKIVCPFRTVIKLIPQIGQETNWCSPTWSNSKLPLQSGQVNIMVCSTYSISSRSPINIFGSDPIKKCLSIL